MSDIETPQSSPSPAGKEKKNDLSIKTECISLNLQDLVTANSADFIDYFVLIEADEYEI